MSFPLGKRHTGIYLLDVSGHGVPAALLSVTLSRILAPIADQPSLVEQKTSGDMTPKMPAEVAADLNRRFPMSQNGLQYFTLFYGVLDVEKTGSQICFRGPSPGIAHFGQGENELSCRRQRSDRLVRRFSF